jgi:anti-sigma factor RsiW
MIMDKCDDARARYALYVDEELEGAERDAFEAHLRRCPACSLSVKTERALLETVRGSQPLYVASADLRERVTRIVAESVVAAPPSLKERIRESLAELNTRRTSPRMRWSLAVTAVLILILPVVVWRVAKYDVRPGVTGPSHFALMAADTHLRHTRGQLPLEITSSGPERISAWFADKIQFGVKLPNYQDSSGQEKLYRLEGARLVGYKDDYAAYVAYQMRTRPISLVITSDKIAQPSGGEEIKARGLTFHYDSIQGLKVITWSDRGLTYALVSDLDQRGQESCVVCHQGASDQDFIAPLKSK